MSVTLFQPKRRVAAFVVCLLLMHCSFSQTTITFVSKEDNKPVYGVHLYDCDKQLKAVSNEAGRVEVKDLCYPIFLKHYEFEDMEIAQPIDRIQLAFRFSELSEIEVKPVNKMELYNTIINTSSDEVKKNSGVRHGTYFQALMLVDVSKADTCYVDRSASVAIQTENDKKAKTYSLFCANARQSIQNFEKTVMDTSAIIGFMKILPSFESNFDYDLMQKKKYKLKFEENEIDYTNTTMQGLRFTRETTNAIQSYTTYFDASKLLYWSGSSVIDKPYAGQAAFFNIDEGSRTYSFDAQRYEMNGVLNKTEMTMFYNGALYKVYLVQGFREDDTDWVESSEKVTNLSSYFKSVPYSQETSRFYVFE